MASDYTRTESMRRDERALMREVESAGSGTEFKGRSCRCPFHDDRNASAGIYQTPEGVWRFKCNGGSCGINADVIEVMILKSGGTRESVIAGIESPGGKPITYGHRQLPPAAAPAASTGKVYPSFDAVKADYARWTTIEAVYPYVSPVTGKPDCWVMRHTPPGEKKRFAQFIPGNGTQVIAQGPAAPWPLFLRRRILTADCVIVVEGEKCAMAIGDKTGITATTALGGAGNGKAEKTDWTPLAGKRVWLWPDNDAPGRAYMAEVERILWELPVPPLEIHRVEPNDMGLTDKQDAADLLASEEGEKSELSEYLWQLVRMNSQERGPLAALDDRLAAIREGRIVSVPMPFRRLSKVTNALMPGCITILAGDPGATKSFFTFACAIAWERAGWPWAIFAVEDGHAVHMQRVLAMLAGDGRLTNAEWCERNDGEVRHHRQRHGAELNQIAKRIKTIDQISKRKAMTIKLEELAAWAEARAVAGDRVVVIDPVTAASKTGKPWEADLDFLTAIKTTAETHQCSIVCVTHPAKGKRIAAPCMDDLAGGTPWSRFSHSIIWIEYLPAPTTAMVREHSGDMPLPMTHNRVVSVLKARNGIGSGMRLAFTFDPQTLGFDELGVIDPNEKKKKGLVR